MAKKAKFNYFDAFEQQIDIALEEADVLVETIEKYKSAEKLLDVLEKAHEIEHRGDEVYRLILTNVSVDFITPIERADIIELAQDIDDVTDYIEGVIQRFYMFDVNDMHPNAIDFATNIKKSVKELRKCSGTFREFKKVKKVRAIVEDVSKLEEQADEMYLEVIRKLYTTNVDNPVYIQVWSRLFERLEGACDSCKAVADTMASIMLKNV